MSVRKEKAPKRLAPLPTDIILRGKRFGIRELKIIREIIARHASQGRTKISVEVCKALDWRQPNGWLKDRACRDVLRTLDAQGIVKLPESKLAHRSLPYSKWKPLRQRTDKISPVEVRALPAKISLVMAKGNKEERHWNEIVQQYHYLGHKVAVGRCLKFLVLSKETIVGAVSLSDSAWALRDRDKILERLGYCRDDVANNSRFLILPSVRVKYLASRILALLAKEGVRHWESYYSTPVRCLESFVDMTRFAGTCYKAANWVIVGKTRGFRKSGSCHHNSQVPKYVFMYPLNTSDRELLRREFQNPSTTT